MRKQSVLSMSRAVCIYLIVMAQWLRVKPVRRSTIPRTNRHVMKRFALGQNTVDVDRNAIQRKNETFRISTREMEVLDYLANNGRVVSRTELLENVWADVVVNSEVVTLTISRLRSVLGDDSRRPQIIETIPKKGYRLMVTPEVTATTAKPHRSVLRSGWFWVGTLTCLLLVMIALFSVVRTEYGKLESERGADVVVEEATK